jgi:hypothetical protein
MIAHDLPGELRPHVLVVGSLAAAYHFRDTIHRDGIATKDADCVIHPAGALMECQAIATQLLSDGWRRRDDCSPREQPEPDTALRAIRLNPPSTDAYFIELLAFPDVGQKEAVRWIPFQLSDGWYCLPSFRYLGLAGRDWKQAENGLHYAAPEMLALANLLAHPEVGTRKMSGQIGNRTCCDPRRISDACWRWHGSPAAAARRRGSRAGRRRSGRGFPKRRRVGPLRGRGTSRAARRR